MEPHPMTVAVCFTVCGREDLLDLALHAHRIFTPKDTMYFVADAGGYGLRLAHVKDRVSTASMRMLTAPAIITNRTPHPKTAHIGAMQAKEYGPEWLVLSNDDIVVGPLWLETMMAEWAALEKAGEKPGLLAASTNYCKGPQRRVGGELMRTPIAIPFFALTKTEDYFKVGGFPLDTPGSWFGDDCLAIDYKRAGFSLWTSSVFVQHFGSQSLEKAKVNYSKEQFDGERYMRNRYGPGWRDELSRL